MISVKREKSDPMQLHAYDGQGMPDPTDLVGGPVEVVSVSLDPSHVGSEVVLGQLKEGILQPECA